MIPWLVRLYSTSRQSLLSSHLVLQLSCCLTSDRPLQKHNLLCGQIPITVHTNTDGRLAYRTALKEVSVQSRQTLWTECVLSTCRVGWWEWAAHMWAANQTQPECEGAARSLFSHWSPECKHNMYIYIKHIFYINTYIAVTKDKMVAALITFQSCTTTDRCAVFCVW